MRIILADPHPQTLRALKTILQENPDFEIIGEVVDADSLIELVAERSLDLALIDWELPDHSIEDLISEIHAFNPKPIVVVMGSKPEYGSMLLKAGADAFISKSDQPDWLLETLQKFEKRRSKTTKIE
jgi:two-component system response regulator FimZ (fimbrial Z protein)